MTYGQKPALTAGRLAAIFVALAILTALTIWQLVFRPPLPLENAQPDPEITEFRGETMGTHFSVKIAPPVENEEEIARLISDRLNDIDRRMSTYKPDSELSRFNSAKAGEPFEFSEETFEVFQISQQISEQTAGAFDVTVGPLVNAWGFGPQSIDTIPTDDQIDALRNRVGYRLLSLDPVSQTVTKLIPEVYCDLSAIAQGYASDKVAEALEDAGFNNFMVEVSGEVRTLGLNAHGEPWQIGIETPTGIVGDVYRTVPLSGLALATSGDYRNFYEKDGVRYSHEIDPKTGKPVLHAAASVTVIHHECAYADAFATAMMVLGPDDGIALAEEMGLPVLFIVRVGESFEERSSTPFDAYFNASRKASEGL